MADQTLQVKIEGDLKNLQAALTQAKKNLKQFGTDADVAGEQLERSFDGATQATNRLDNAEKRLANTTKGLRTSIGSANGVAIEFNRIIQDAPFGIIGIGNNIQQLTANFAQLRAQSPSTGKAIVSALTSLVSPANLVVLGISAVTAAFTAYQMGAFGASKETNELKDAQDALNDSLKETDKLARAAFYNQILKDLGLLRFEVDATGKALGAVPTNLPFAEQLKLISDRIKTATKPELEALSQFLKENYQTNVRAATNATSDLEKQIAESQAGQYKTQLELVNKQLAFYKDETNKAKDLTKEWNAELEQTNFLIGLQNDLMKRASQELPKAYQEVIDSFGAGGIKDIALPNISGIPTKDEPILTADIIASNDFYTGLSRAQSAFESFGGNFQVAVENFAFNINDLVRNNLATAFEDFGSSIGEALVSGESVINALGESLLKSMASFMSDFGKQLIAVGVAGLAFSTLLETIKAGGPAAIPAAIAAIGAGVALSVAAGALRGIAGKGLGGGGSVSSSSYGSSSQAYSGTGAQAINLEFGEFEIRGTKLVGVIKATEKKQARG